MVGKPTEKVIPIHYGANGASENGHIDVLKWLAKRNILPDIDGSNLAGFGKQEVINWLAENNKTAI